MTDQPDYLRGTGRTVEEANGWWRQVKIEEDLRKHTILSSANIAHLTRAAALAVDPVAYLNQELAIRARSKKAMIEAQHAQRMKEDADRISNPSSWPVDRLPLKTQPWQNEDGKSMRFAHGYNKDYLIVHTVDGETLVYDTIEELVDMWSVD